MLVRCRVDFVNTRDYPLERINKGIRCRWSYKALADPPSQRYRISIAPTESRDQVGRRGGGFGTRGLLNQPSVIVRWGFSRFGGWGSCQEPAVSRHCKVPSPKAKVVRENVRHQARRRDWAQYASKQVAWHLPTVQCRHTSGGISALPHPLIYSTKRCFSTITAHPQALKNLEVIP